MEGFWIVIGVVAIICVAFAGINDVFTNAKRDFKDVVDLGLPNKFAELGTLGGRTKDEIVLAVGEPTSVTFNVGDGDLLQWITKNYHIALLFKDDICLGITHESTFKY
jgi:hypothetical protein